MATLSGETKTWHKITLDFEAPTSFDEEPGTFRDYRLDVTFTSASTGEAITVPGFFARTTKPEFLPTDCSIPVAIAGGVTFKSGTA